MGSKAIKIENLSKAYQVGDFSSGTISRDLERYWALLRGKEDPFLKIGETNDRTQAGKSDIIWSLKDINFEIEQGDTVGIIGRNGAGKSTLLKVLSRVTSPTTGSIKIKGRIASLLEVGTGFHPELTGRENIYLNGAILGMRKAEIKRKFDEIVDFSGVERYIDTPVKRYSSGMYVRLAFAVAAHLESEILIVDEVLAVGDAEFQKKCLGKMKDVSTGEGRTVLFVSHNMAAVKSFCTKGIILNQGTIFESGTIEKVVSQYFSAISRIYEGAKNIKSHNNENIAIDKFKIVNNYQQPDMVRFDSPIVINIRGTSLSAFNDISLGICFMTLENIPVFTTRLNDSNNSIKLNGRFDITVKIEHNLRAGNYIVLLGIDSQIDTLYYHPSIAKLEVLDVGDENYKTKNYGIISVKSHWEVSQ